MFTKGALQKFNRQSTINVFCNATNNYRLPETWCHNSHCWLHATIQNDAIPFSLQTKKNRIWKCIESPNTEKSRGLLLNLLRKTEVLGHRPLPAECNPTNGVFLGKKRLGSPKDLLSKATKTNYWEFHVPTQCRTFWNNDPIKNPCFQTIMPLSSYSTAPVLVL